MIKRVKKKDKARRKKHPKSIGAGSNKRTIAKVDGIPQATPPNHKSLLGNRKAPDTDGKEHLDKEKVMGQVEILLLKGVISTNQIAVTLGIAYMTAKKYVEQVHYRWSFSGGPTRMHQLKGEARARLDIINSELWMLFSNSNDTKEKVVIMNQLLNVHDRKLIVEGMTPQIMESLATEVETKGVNVKEKMIEHSKAMKLVGMLKEFTSKSVKEVPIEDAEFTEVTE